MQAIVLAAGEGRRMLPLTTTLPKGILPIGGRPLLEHLMLRAKEAGAERFVIVVGHQREKIIDAFGDGSRLGVEIEYAFQEERLGTGSALRAAEALAEDRFLVIHGDVLPDADSVRRLMALEAPAIAAARVDGPRPVGDWILEVGEGRLKSISEGGKKTLSNLVSAGIFLLDKRTFEALRRVPSDGDGEETDLMTAVNVLLDEGVQIGVEVVERWIEIVFPWDILRANETLMPPDTRGVLGEVEANASLSGEVAVGRGTAIRSGSYVAGPVVIGEGCEIGPNCLIRGATSIGDGVRIGSGVVIEETTIMEGAEVSHLCYVGDSLIGPGCSLGVGTVIANRRHDGSQVRSFPGGARTDTCREDLGAVLGEGVKTGAGTIVYPGTVIEAGRWGRPGEVLWGYVQAGKVEEDDEGDEEAGGGDTADGPGAGALRTKRVPEGPVLPEETPREPGRG